MNKKIFKKFFILFCMTWIIPGQSNMNFLANAQTAPAACDGQLGRNYDNLSREEKSKRMTLYLNCRSKTDINLLRSRHREVLRQVQNWKMRASQITNSSMNTENLSLRAKLKVAHDTENSALDTEFENKYTELESTRTPTNNSELNQKRNEITTELRSTRADLRQSHREQTERLNQTINQCRSNVTMQINSLAQSEKEDVENQFIKKIARLKNEHNELLNTPPELSINEYKAKLAENKNNSTGEKPIGIVSEGSANITRSTGETVSAEEGTSVYLGDIVETGDTEPCNIIFDDDSSFSISEGANLKVDEYIYDPEYDPKTGGFSILRGIFVFTSGIIGGKEPKKVEYEEVLGETGIRG